jgi:uncharacterized membrane protein (DUF373 family)
MRSFKEIKEHYDLSPEDIRRLNSLKPLMEEHSEEVAETLSAWILSTKIGLQLLSDDNRRLHLFEAQKKWFLELFEGPYDTKYYERLIKIGIVHVKNSVDAHYLNRAVNIVRNVCINILHKSCGNVEETIGNIIAFEKILDINLDVMTSSYIEEEIRNYSPVYRVKSLLIDYSEKFVQITNLALIFALIGLTLGAIGLFVRDATKFVNGDLESAIISALGSLLILWVMIELMNTEITHLKGGKFRISVFVSVALVAVIRETMIATLKHEQSEMMMYLIAAILSIGFVYWLVIKGEDRRM